MRGPYGDGGRGDVGVDDVRQDDSQRASCGRAHEARKRAGPPAIVNQSAESYAAEKAAELRQVGALFGVTDVRVLQFTDKPFVVERQPDSIEVMRELILETRPHVVLTQSPFVDRHHGMASATKNDHTETGMAAMEAKLLAQLPRYGQRTSPHTVPATFFPGHLLPTRILGLRRRRDGPDRGTKEGRGALQVAGSRRGVCRAPRGDIRGPSRHVVGCPVRRRVRAGKRADRSPHIELSPTRSARVRRHAPIRCGRSRGKR